MGSGQASLSNIDPATVSNLPRKGLITKCRVCSVHDGDTITIMYLNGSQPFKINLRMEGIDAPELTSKDPLEKEAAIRVRDWLKTKMECRKYWYVLPKKWDKYGGRMVGTLHFNNHPKSLSINDLMVNQGLVVPYHGAKKEAWTAQKLKDIIASVALSIPSKEIH